MLIWLLVKLRLIVDDRRQRSPTKQTQRGAVDARQHCPAVQRRDDSRSSLSQTANARKNRGAGLPWTLGPAMERRLPVQRLVQSTLAMLRTSASTTSEARTRVDSCQR